MANQKISELTNYVTPTDVDLIPIVDVNAVETKKITWANIKSNLAVKGPQGFATNYKIVTSVSSGNLTVALKTLAGGDPSATDPIYVRIGDTVRTITAATSRALPAGQGYYN